MAELLPSSLKGRDFIHLSDLSREELDAILALSFDMKREQRSYRIDDKTLVMLFFNYSLRTRTSFEIGARQLGINVVTINALAEGWDLEWRDGVTMNNAPIEHAKDAARVLSRYADAIGVRSYPPMTSLQEDRKDSVVNTFRTCSNIPVINLESAVSHPCQGLADIMTMRELFPSGVRNKKVVLSWAPNPRPVTHSVANSFLYASAYEGANVVLTHPEGFDLDESVIKSTKQMAEQSGGNLSVTNDRNAALDGADIVYAKSWASTRHYGDWVEDQRLREQHVEAWRIRPDDMRHTHRAKFMHPLPLRRNYVADDAVIDGPDCVVYQQAENRLHAQKALLAGLFG